MPYTPMELGSQMFDIPNPEPNTHYRWIRWTNARNFGGWLRKFGGRPAYGVVQGKTVEDTKKLAAKLGRSPEEVNEARNRIEIDDVVLVSIPLDEYKRRQAEMVAFQRRIASVTAQDETIEAFNETHGKTAKMFRAEMHEMHERKQHAEREGRPFVAT